MKDRNILDGDVKKKILNFLKDKNHPQRTLAIAKACNFLTSKEINPTIYHLERQGTLVKCDLSPPSWKLSSTLPAVGSLQVQVPSSRGSKRPKNKVNITSNNRITLGTKSSTNPKAKPVSTKSPHASAHPKRTVSSRTQDSMGDSYGCTGLFPGSVNAAPGAYVPRERPKEEMEDYFYQLLDSRNGNGNICYNQTNGDFGNSFCNRPFGDSQGYIASRCGNTNVAPGAYMPRDAMSQHHNQFLERGNSSNDYRRQNKGGFDRSLKNRPNTSGRGQSRGHQKSRGVGRGFGSGSASHNWNGMAGDKSHHSHQRGGKRGGRGRGYDKRQGSQVTGEHQTNGGFSQQTMVAAVRGEQNNYSENSQHQQQSQIDASLGESKGQKKMNSPLSEGNGNDHEVAFNMTPEAYLLSLGIDPSSSSSSSVADAKGKETVGGQVSSVVELSEEMSDDDEEDEINTRIQDMIFTSRAVQPVTNRDGNNDEESDDDSGEVIEVWDDAEVTVGMEEGKEIEYWDDGMLTDTKELHLENEVEYWEYGMPTSTPVEPLNLDMIMVNHILECLNSVPLGTTTHSVLISKLALTDDEFDKGMSVCHDKGFIEKTEIGYMKITDAGIAYLKSQKSSPVVAEESLNSPDYSVTREIRALGDYEDDNKVFKCRNGSHSVGRGHRILGNVNNSFPTKSSFGGFSNKNSHTSSHNNSNFLPSGPAPSPLLLLQGNDSFRSEPRVQTTALGLSRGFGRGQMLQNMKHMSLVRLGGGYGDATQEPYSSDDDTTTICNNSKNNDHRSRLQQNAPTSSVAGSDISTLNSGLENLMPWRTSNSSFSVSAQQHPSSSIQSASSSSQLLPSFTQALPSTASNSPLKSQPQPLLVTPSSSSATSMSRRPPLLGTPSSNVSSSCNSSAINPVTVRQPLLPVPASTTSFSTQTPQPVSVPVTNSATLQINSESFAALNKNPISAFMEYAQSRKLMSELKVVNAKGPPHKPQFFISAFLGGRCLATVNCHNKKDGRKAAAEQALRALHNEGLFHLNEEISVMKMAADDMTTFDKIAALTHQKFNQLIASIPESFTGRKVIAGLVMKMGQEDVGSVIAIGSGNRCITGDKLSLEGKTVNDCHAEIITRRGFIRFLYQQLSTYKEGQDHPILEMSDTGKVKVKDEVTFHLYISTAPCGDGALFSPRDAVSNAGVVTETDGAHRPTFTTQVHGVLRTKMEGGEGTIPINPSETVQTWDGIVRGERLRTMSCSDKICRWNVLGLQGALLSNFVDTVYLSSLTLGFLFDHGHLSRAVCCRLDRGDTITFKDQLPEGYRLNHPTLGRVTACDPPRETQKTKSYSINWAACDERPELLDGTLGHCHTGIEKRIESRITKSQLFHTFKRLCRDTGRPELLVCHTYHQAKQANPDFTSARQILMKQFEESKCGRWVHKPVEEEMFSM